MNELIKIGNQEITKKEFNNQRVVTLKDIDLVHERPEGTAGRNFRENKERFIKGEDYYLVKPSDVQGDEIRRAEINNYGTCLITEQGYLMLVKSFTDDLAWKVQRRLVNTYFRAKKLSPQDMMRIQLGTLDDHEGRLDKLENTMTIDYGQQQVLKKKVNIRVMNWLEGKHSNAYKCVSKKVFSECNRDIQDYFDVNSRNNIPKLKFEEVINYIENWEPSTNTKMLIRDYNSQMTFN